MHYLGFLGLFGSIITFIEAFITMEPTTLANGLDKGHGKELLWNTIGFSSFNFMCYSIIPFFVQRSGATLLNISNVTTVIWSMLADILIFGKDFHLAYVIAFALEITGVVIFSAEKPINPESGKLDDENEL